VSPPQQGEGIHFADLERGLGSLPDEQREALLLVTASGLSYEEAAEVMGCALGTIKSRVGRARGALVRYLDGPDSDAKSAALQETALAPAA
jgi:RNA polymerase sigma-70 factor (ECF subfamily)